MQRLILPINQMFVTAAYKTPAYRKRFGFTHYGYDATSLSGTPLVYASGEGKVLFTGKDSIVGNVVAAIYYDVLNHKTNTSADLIMRYFHLDKILVQDNQDITKDTQIGFYGNTGKYSTGAHLHFEFDSDTDWPLYTSTLSANASLMRAAITDTSLDPAEILHIKSSAPDNQRVVADSSSYYNERYAPAQSVDFPEFSE